MSLDVLNCKLGDLKFTFDKSDPKELAKAKSAVEKMIRDGFIILVEVEIDGKIQTKRVESFDPETDSYVIKEDRRRGKRNARDKRTGKWAGKQKLPADKHKATAIAPRAGG